jgi:AcrR family transcriptional regulator
MEVKRRRGRPGKDRGKLEESRIVQTAKDITLRESRVPSIRRLASELDVDPMAIYYYFSNKKALLEAVSSSLIGELYSPVGNLPWKENLRLLCRSYISLLLDYPDLVSIILSIPGEGAATVFMQRFETCVEGLSLEREESFTITSLLADYIHGFSFAAACSGAAEITVDLAEKPLAFIIDNIRPS